MELKTQESRILRRQLVVELGLDPNRFDLMSPETLAGALRRAASFLCPCPASLLVRAVVRPLRGLISVGEQDEIGNRTQKILMRIVAHGDLLEFQEFDDSDRVRERILLFASPLTFIPRDTGTYILLGIAGEIQTLPSDLVRRIDHVGHTRRLRPDASENLREKLKRLGLREMPLDTWRMNPKSSTPWALVSKYNELLSVAGPSGDVPGLRLLDSERSVKYYPDRWMDPHKQSGLFVARRSQAYGAPLWSYVQVIDGEPQKLIDLPLLKSRWRGCDEAWHLQMAIDANRGHPQQFAIRVGSGDKRIVAFFSPVPMWAQRRWDAVGERISSDKCLFSYQFHNSDFLEEIRFIRQVLWLNQAANQG